MTYDEAGTAFVHAVCEWFNTEPRLIRRIIFTHRDVAVEIYSLNNDGAKFIDADGHVATDIRTLEFKFLSTPPRDVYSL